MTICLQLVSAKKNTIHFHNKTPIFIDNLSLSYTPHISNYIINSVQNPMLVDNENDAYIRVYHVNRCNWPYDKNKINVVISGETNILNDSVDLCISPVLNQQAKHNIYYPFMYSSLFEHRKSINNANYFRQKTKFCAYIYRSVHCEHFQSYFKIQTC